MNIVDASLLLCAKKSAPYRRLRHRLHSWFAEPIPPLPIESWSNEEFAYFVFDLIPNHPGAPIPPLAVFVVKRQLEQLLLVRLISPNREATEAHIIDLYQRNREVSTEHGTPGGPAKQCEDELASVSPTYLSCRRFLQAIGVLDPDTKVHCVPLPAFVIGILPPVQADLEQARSIATTSPLFHQLLDELRNQSFTFDLNMSRLVRSADHPELIGLALESVKALTRPGWANIVLTIDRGSRSVAVGHYTRGEEFSRRLKVYSVATTSNQRSEQQQTYPLRRIRACRKPVANDTVPGNCEPSMWSQCGPYVYAGAVEWCVFTWWIHPFFYLHCVKYQQACQTYSRQMDCSISTVVAWHNDNYLYFHCSDSFCV